MKTGIYTVAKTLCRELITCVTVLLTQVSLTLFQPTDGSWQAHSAHGILHQENWSGLIPNIPTFIALNSRHR